MIKVGPAGLKESGVNWDESGCSNVVQIFIWHDYHIKAIQIQYVENGNLLLSRKHGGNDGQSFSTVKLNYPLEYITCVSGFYDVGCGISSLSFRTNKGTYGPFGDNTKSNHWSRRKFKLETGENNQFGGFHGTYFDHFNSGRIISSIGVYVKPSNVVDSPQSSSRLVVSTFP